MNPNKVNLTQIELVDDLSSMNPKHTFVPDGSTDQTIVDGIKDEIAEAVKAGLSKAGISSAVKESVVVELVDNKLIIKMSNLGKNSFSFQLKTYASEPSFYAGNANDTFKNNVTMSKAGTSVDNIPISTDISASASIAASSTVLTKEHVSYDPISKKLTWRLTVDANETDLGDVDIIDELEAGLSCNVDEATLNGGGFTGGNTFIVDEKTNTIKIKLVNVKKKQTITFTTTVDVDGEIFRTKDKVVFSNTAKLTSQTNPKTVKSETSLTLSNKALSKAAVQNDQNLTADYTVKLNPLSMDLLKGLPENQKLQLEDTLPDGLYLDLDSVKLYNAVVLGASKTSDTYTVDMSKGELVDTAIDYEPATRTLTVDIPDASKGYILTYKTYIVRTGVDLKNDIRLVGSVLPDDSAIKNTYNTMKVASNGNAKMVLPKASFVSLQIKKVGESGNILNGAVFGLYEKKADATPLVTATCDNVTGISTLAVPKSLVKGKDTLYWKEITAPVGYELNSEWHEVDVTNYNPEMVINVVNVPTGDAVSAQIKLKKTDSKDSSKVLSDAVFALYTDKECTLPVMETGKPLISTSGNDGVITFTGLYPEQTYYVREMSAPKGYVRSEQTITVIAKKTWVDSDAIPITNEKADVTLKVTKVDALDSTKTLSGAVFQLYEDEDCKIKVGESQSATSDGTLSFTGLFPYSTYYLREITAPEGYMLNPNVFDITTVDNGELISKQIGNYLIGWNEKASIIITKTNEDGTELLPLASFALYGQDKVTLLGQQSTDEEGICTFTGLSKGIYYIRETVAPEGYVLSNEWIEVSVEVNEALHLTIINKEITPETPTNPIDPTNPTNPTNPTEPTNPTNPTDPIDPTDPSDPQVPEKPDGSDNGNKPDKSDGSDTGNKPDKPDGSDTGNKPDKSDGSNTGNKPEKPGGPKTDEETKSDSIDDSKSNSVKEDDKTNGISNESLPKTGVETHYLLWISCLTISLIMASTLVVLWRRQNKRMEPKRKGSK